LLAIPIVALAACGGEGDLESPMDSSLDLAGVADDCPAGQIGDDIAAIFPTDESLRHVATVNCGQVFKDFGKGKQAQAIQKAMRFFQKTLQQYENDQLLDPAPSVEARIVDLFTAIFAGIGSPLGDIDPDVIASGEYAIGRLVPGGPPVLTVSGHAGIDDGGGLLGPVDVVIFQIFPPEVDLELSSASHPCPAGVDDTFDCYPLFFDYSVFPETNVNPAVGLQLGQCNVSPEGIEVLLLSPEGFLPEDDAPNGVLCDDVQPEEVSMTGWRKYAWAALEPISPLFRVTPAIAGKNPIGGRISAFSPVAPADPESGGEEDSIATTTAISPSDAGSLFGPTQQTFTAAVTEVVGGDGVDGGTVTFTVTNGDNVTEMFDADVVEGAAEMTVGCFSEGGDVFVTSGSFTVSADFLGTATHGSSSDPTPSTFSCSIIG
jgi:hypothetical protein